MSQHHVVLLLGSNLGNTTENIETAIRLIEEKVGIVVEKSEFLQTNAVEFDSINIFCNLALAITTYFSPVKLLQAIKVIEREMGRLEDSRALKNYKDRIIDIDIVLYDNLSFECEHLKIPHQKNLYHRDFSKYLLSQLDKKNQKHEL